MPELRVLLADDHAILRDGLRSLIDRQPGMRVVAEADDATSAVERSMETTPDVAVLDLSMPGGGGLAAMKRLRVVCPNTRILVLTMHDDAAHLRSVLDAGAAGYVAKRSAATDLIDAIREVAAGRSFVRASLREQTLGEVVSGVRATGAELSSREREVLGMIVRGHSNREVAARLGVAKQTVDTYRLRLQDKLGLKGRAALVRYALSHGLLPANSPSERPPPAQRQKR